MSLTGSFATTAAAVVALGLDAATLGALSDDALLAAHTLLTDHRRHADTIAAHLAGEIARRSTRDDGYAGLAQRKGFGSATGLLQSLSPVTASEASQLISAGVLLADPPSTLWEGALAQALSAGLVSVAATDAIRRGLTPVAETAPAEELLAECQRLLSRSPQLSIDELRREARSARDRIDEAGIARRERQRRDLRYLKRWVRDDGMYQGAFLLDPEAGLHLFTALDAIMAPRRAVRFVDATAPDEAVLTDTRTDDQLLADALTEMVRLAVGVDPGTLFGTNRPAVRVIVTETSLREPGGHGYLEGDSHPVSRETVDRHLCDTGFIGIKFDRKGQILDLGRTERLFVSGQRLVISVRDGGCLFLHCTKPPSACEVHHITDWRHGGKTDVRDGVLLCQHHHMLLHNNKWKILREHDRYWLKPPVTEDPDQRLRPLPTKSPLLRELMPAK
ncbi:MAG TPA: DUF222 domain-containing protein [Rhodoglobus sp.]|nr:DUF222 domain-containing protein [Rhodoglobus sp.]